MRSKRIKAIIFDVDGTLYSNLIMGLAAPLSYLMNIHWIFRFSRMRRELRRQLFLNSPRDIDDTHNKYQFDAHCISLLSCQIRLPMSAVSYILKHNIHDLWIRCLRHTPLRIGMRLLLGSLYRQGYMLGIISDFEPEAKLRQWNIHDYFHTIICSEYYGVLKPDRRIFLKACKNLGCAPDEAIYVGNHLYYDGIGATKANMPTIIMHNKNRQVQRIAEQEQFMLARNVRELTRVLRTLGVDI